MYDKDFISKLQNNTENIRNFCILAHVDHGKTTLADTLLVNNGIISKKMSGKLRYMDSRQDEQERGITMKSSAITLVHTNSQTRKSHLINLIDSPGHVDFSTEVSTAVRLCDGAAILIDVCEGICPQTHAVLRQAWLENLKLVLILNKIDRLILELQMTPNEAYSHMMFILEQFNALVAQQFTSLLLEKNIRAEEHESDENVDWGEDVDESKLYFSPKYNNVFFASSLDGWGFSINNFADIFSNKLGFKKEILLKTLWGDYYLNAKTKRIMANAQNNGRKPIFVQLILENLWQVYDAFFTRRDTVMMDKILNSLNIKLAPRELKFTEAKAPIQALFANWLPLGKNLLDMIVEVLPSPVEMTNEKTENLMCSKIKIFKSLCKETQELKKYFMNCKPDDSKPTIAFISKMFVAEKDCIAKKQITMTVEDIATKREAIRLIKLLQEANKQAVDLATAAAVASQTTSIFESATIKEESKNDNNNNNVEEDQKYEFLAFARVFSGTLKKGQTLFILSPRHNPEDFIGKNVTIETSVDEIQAISKCVLKFTISELYLMMGRELEQIDSVPCGNIAAIGGLKQFILKSATLSTNLFCPSFTSMNFQTTPIVRVAVEPKNPSKIKDLIKGLKLLNQADPCVEIIVLENGEHILCAAGEVHLQRCIDDLVKQFAKCEVNVSPPIIPFKETIVRSLKATGDATVSGNDSKQQSNQGKSGTNKFEERDKLDEASQTQASALNSQGFILGPEGRVEMFSSDKKLRVWIKAKPLPLEFVRFMEENSQLTKLLNKLNQNKMDAHSGDCLSILVEFRDNLKRVFVEAQADDEYYAGKDWENLVDRFISFGPNRSGPNVLVDSLNSADSYALGSVWASLDCFSSPSKSAKQQMAVNSLREFENNIIFGFNLATAKGPLCEEPVQGVAFFLENFQIMDSREEILMNELNEKLNITAESLEDDTKSIDTTRSYDTLADSDRLERKIKSQSLPAQCISLIKDACRKSFEVQPQRLMAAMCKCEILTVSSEALGKLYAVLGKRNAKILDESIKEGSSMFMIKANVPVADSFGLSEEIRKRTSGLATPHIEFSHYEIIDIDPYWEPKTEEELLHYGDKADFENQARKYMNDVRKRKGLFVREKLVEHAEKQRNLTVK